MARYQLPRYRKGRRGLVGGFLRVQDVDYAASRRLWSVAREGGRQEC